MARSCRSVSKIGIRRLTSPWLRRIGVALFICGCSAFAANAQSVFVVTVTDDAGPASLREAITSANATANLDGNTPDEIRFNIPGAGPHTIQVLSPLPAITDPVIIDGFSQPGSSPDTNGPGEPYNGVLQIVLEGSMEPAGFGLQISTNGSTIRGLVINQFYLDGVQIWTVESTGNLVTECFIGTDVTGTIALGNGRNSGGESLGVRVGGLASFNMVRRNVISGNVQSGVSLDNSGNNNIIVDNAIGTDPTGTFAVPNGGSGMNVQSGTFSNIIQGNLISGNTVDGISSFGGANTNTYDDNTIGTNLRGTIAIPNGQYGMTIFGDGGDVISNNHISGNMLDGIVSGEPGLVITDNLIGPDITGSQIIPNQRSALELSNGGHLIERNVLAGNTNAGIAMKGPLSNITIRNNAIGVDATGKIKIGQFAHGIFLQFGPQSDILIESNFVAGAVNSGINVIGDNITGITLSQNSVFENGLLGIDLVADSFGFGFSANDFEDADLGGNNLQNYPNLLNVAVDDNGDLEFTYTVDSTPGNSTYPIDVEFFLADVDNQEGQIFIGSGQVLAADVGVSKQIVLGNAVALGVTEASRFVATATDANGNTSEFSPPAGLETQDLLALEALFNSTGGENWLNNTNWMTSAPIETWYGVTAVDGVVTALNLGSNNLMGVIPSEIVTLTGIEQLSLYDNQLSGSIPPEMGEMPSLNTLDLFSNILAGQIPAELANLNLTRLWLSNNQLSGPIPDGLQATFLYLDGNQLTGQIPSGTTAWILDFSNNQLTGEIPDVISTRNVLGFLVEGNQLTGQIPAALGNYSDMTYLYLGNNLLTGEIPDEIGTLTSLEYLSLTGEEPVGKSSSPNPIPWADVDPDRTIIEGHRGELDNGRHFPKSDNRSSNAGALSGPLPESLINLTNLAFLDLSGNQFTGSVPDLSDVSGLETLLLRDNLLEDLPDMSGLVSLTSFDISLNHFTFEDIEPNVGHASIIYAPQLPFGTPSTIVAIDGQPFSAMFSVGGSANQYQWFKEAVILQGENTDTYVVASASSSDEGTYTLSVTSQIVPGLTLLSNPVMVTFTAVDPMDASALEALYNSTGGADWTDNTNWLSAAPPENWYGIEVSSGRVTTIDLRSNNLNGSFPPEWNNLINAEGALSELLVLRLASDVDIPDPPNNLDGVIPEELGSLANLEVLELDNTGLSGTIPESLGSLSNLVTLNLSGNQLSGSIPSGIEGLTSLTSLSLHENQLTGAIPSSVGSMSNLDFLKLDRNQLSGQIPVEIGNLTNLTFADLRFNLLSGAVPAELGGLLNLSYLELEGNQLTGQIPSEIGSLTELQHLGLGANQFTGMLPAELGTLQSLTFINIADNSVTGSIPSALGDASRLEIVYLNNNQLSGFIPAELGNLANLKDLRLNENQLDGAVPGSFNNFVVLDTLHLFRNLLDDLPDLSNLGSLTSFRIEDNQLSFEDLEPNISIIGFEYVPQADFGVESTVAVNEGDPLLISFSSPGTSNQYQWLKDGSPIGDANSVEYAISSTALNDSGVYSLTVTNSLVPDLILQSAPITVTVKAIIIDVTEPTAVDAVAGSDIPVSVVLPPNYQPQAREICYRRTAELDYQCVPLIQAGGSDTGQIPSEFVTERGVEYFYRFTLGNDMMTVPAGGEANPYRLQVDVSSLQAGGVFSAETYRMVSVPLILDNPQIDAVLNEYGTYDPAKWRLFRWNAATQDYQEHPNTEISFTPCTAFWLITTDGPAFGVENGTSIDPTSQCGTSRLILKPGWNQFGIPRAFSIAWEDVQKSGELDTPVLYNASEIGSDPYTYNVSTLLPWEGYWVNNPGTQDVEVLFPATESTAKTGKDEWVLPFISESAFVLQLTATLPRYPLVDRHNYVGTSVEASDGADRMDFSEAPGIGSYVRLSLMESDHRLAGDFKSYNPDGSSWNFEITADLPGGIPVAGDWVIIETEELIPLQPQHEIYILDVDTEERIQLTNGSVSVKLTRDVPIRHFQIIVGTSDYAADASGGLALSPQTFALEQNYPNPFNPTTQIRYQLSEQAHVVLDLYNPLGQRVSTLVDADQDVGWYEVTWDASAETSSALASGVYWYRLRANGIAISRPMVLLK